MSDRLLCIDSDVFALFAAARQLERVVRLLGFPLGDVRRLKELEPMLRKGKKFQQFSAEQRATALEAAEGVAPLTHDFRDPTLKDRLAVFQIDLGEQLLYGALAERPLLWLTSGDKAAMKKLCKSPDLQDVMRAVASRVVSLEAVMYKLFQPDEYEETAKAFGELRTHKTLSCFFPEKAPPPPATPLDGPRSFLRDLCKELGRGFLHCPPCPDSAKGVCLILSD